jgi:hypothetical protein
VSLGSTRKAPSTRTGTRAAILRSATLVVDSTVIPKKLRTRAAKAVAALRAGDHERAAEMLADVAAQFRGAIQAEVWAMASVYAVLAAIHYLNDDALSGAQAARIALRPHLGIRLAAGGATRRSGLRQRALRELVRAKVEVCRRLL